MANRINILHLSDIHFGVEPTPVVAPTAIARRTTTLNGLIKLLSKVDSDWKPNIIVISGDIGWKGISENYKQAKLWLQELLDILNLTSNELIISAGNHDINRTDTIGMPPPISAEQADEWLKVENLKNYIRLFDSYNAFCRDLNIPSLSLGKTTYHLIGQREVKGLRFVVLNSSWFCRGENDKGRLWIGLPQLEVMLAEGQLVDRDNYDEDTITIAVLHHPNSWLAEAEQNGYGNRPNTYRYLSERCHVILSGHVHGAVEQPHRIHDHAYLFVGGATYAGSDYRNNFSILQIDPASRILMRRAFDYDPQFQKWHSEIDKTEYALYLQHSHYPKIGARIETTELSHYNYSALAPKAKEFARRYIEQKSRAVARTKVLPNLIERKVAVHNKEERIKRNLDEEILLLSTKDNLAPFSEMVTAGRPTFLFGELGSGKSTLVADYVVKLSESLGDLIPILIPAGFFLDRKIETIADLSKYISLYVNKQINPSSIGFDLRNALADKQEITLLIDGFDELRRETAKQLLLLAEELTDHWSGLRVIATGRPVELRGLNYNRWTCLEMTPLSVGEQEQLLLNEALAEGFNDQRAKADADRRLRILREMPELLSVATTPLIIRLLRPHLIQTSEKKSLGDLLYDITQERLGEWSSKEGKDINIQDFKGIFPDSLSREGILGRIAAQIYNSPTKCITREGLHTIIESEPELNNISNKYAVISQGCDFFRKNVLQEEGDSLIFPSQPLLQCALGLNILDAMRGRTTIELRGKSADLWREYSFAAAIARRKNLIQELRNHFQAYLSELLDNEELNPATTIIISEAGDKELATTLIQSFKKFDFRPIRFFGDFRSQSAAAFAQCFFLAEDEGFDWFYEHYLDPKYPTLTYSSDEVGALVLQHWVLRTDFKLTLEQKKKLSTIPSPHIAAQSWQAHSLLPTLVLVLPDLFNSDQRARLYADNLESNLFSEKAYQFLMNEFETGNRASVLKALETIVSKGYNNQVLAARLWLELNPDIPTLAVIHSIINLASKNSDQELLENLENRLSGNKLEDTLRWYVFQNSSIAAAAALILYRRGERNLFFLGHGLRQGIHDGGRFEGAEEALCSLIKMNGEQGLVWLLNQFDIPKTNSLFGGAPSAFWRIFLSELNNSNALYTNLFWHSVLLLNYSTLSRNPEIRREFQALLIKKPEYRDILNAGLTSFNSQMRYNAACILLTCFPESETLAAETVLRATVNSLDRHEWNRFCMRLALGENVINHIVTNLDSFLPVPRTFALMLLYHNEYSLTSFQYKNLIEGLLGEGSSFDHARMYRGDDLNKVLEEDDAFEILVECLNNTSLAQPVAHILWTYHRSKLDTEQYITCWAWYSQEQGLWPLREFDDEIKRLNNDPRLLEKITTAAQSIQKQTASETIASVYLRTFTDVSAWRDFIWIGMFEKQRMDHHQIEYCFSWLFNKAKKDDEIAKIAGAAARDFIDHPSITTSGLYNDAMPWLGFLAHEFGNLDNSKIEEILLNYNPIEKNIYSVLIARLGYVPKGFSPKNHSSYTVFAVNESVIVEAPEFEQIIEITRDAEILHKDFILWIEKTLLSGALHNEQLEQLEVKSRFGSLFAIIVLFCRASLRNYEGVVRTIGIEQFKNEEEQTIKVLRSASRNIREIIARDVKYRSYYFECLEQAIINRTHPDMLELYSELLGYQENLKERLLPNLLSELASRPYKLNWNLAQLLSDHFANGIGEDQKAFVTSELKKIVSSLCSVSEESHATLDGLRECLFSLALFYLQETTDEESERVFLRGLQAVFIGEYNPHLRGHDRIKLFKARDVFLTIQPLLGKVPSQLLRQTIKKGLSSDVAEIRSLCGLLSALS
jgi:predicted MPP superfamily phosphohydrolase